MNYLQERTPDLNTSEKAGLCLQFTENSFGVPNLYDNAWKAWEATQYKHTDRDFPAGVAVPVWFDWSGNVMWDDGFVRYGRYGHAAVRAADGRIHSAPGEGVGSQTFDDVDALTRYFGGGMTYVGWSEDIAGVRVIKEKVEPPKFIPMDEPRVMLASTGLHKFNPDTKTFSNDITLNKGDYRLFVDKIQIDNVWYLRTEYDQENNIRSAFVRNNLIDIPATSEIVKRLKSL